MRPSRSPWGSFATGRCWLAGDQPAAGFRVMIVIQHITTLWTKASRGAPASTARNKILRAYPMPPAPTSTCSVFVHRVQSNESQNFDVSHATETIKRALKYAALRTGSLALPIGLHLGGNWITSSIFGLGVDRGNALWGAPLNEIQIHARVVPDLVPHLPYLAAVAALGVFVIWWTQSRQPRAA